MKLAWQTLAALTRLPTSCFPATPALLLRP